MGLLFFLLWSHGVFVSNFKYYSNNWTICRWSFKLRNISLSRCWHDFVKLFRNKNILFVCCIFKCDQNCWVIDDFFDAHDENALLWLKTCTWVIFYWAPKLPDQPVLSLRPLVGDSILFAIDYHNKYSFIKSQKKILFIFDCMKIMMCILIEFNKSNVFLFCALLNY